MTDHDHEAITTALAELEAFGHENDLRQPNRDYKMLNLECETAQLVNLLVRSSQRKQLLEIGTSNGYSTIWLAWAAQETNGHLISIDRAADKHALAQTNLDRVGLAERVTLLTGDATDVVKTLPGPFDFVLFDADRVSAPEQLKTLLPLLLPGALVLADNALSHPNEIAGYLDAVQAAGVFDYLIVPIGKGLSMAYYRPGAKS